MRNIIVSPSLLSADFANLEKELNKLNKTSCEWLHFDVMDGHFVPNLTFGAPIIKALRSKSDKIFDVHLMMDYPMDYLDDFVECGSDYISIHYESPGVKRLGVIHCLQTIRSKGVKAGIVIQPDTDVAEITSCIPYCDLVLVMSVYAGFGGQSFITDSLNKISILKDLCATVGHEILISVDGGINDKTYKQALSSGADVLVSGSYVFKGDYSKKVDVLKCLD